MTSNYSKIPEELKALQSWVCFDQIDGKKIPFIPGSNNQAASNRPRDWRSYRAALKDVESGKRQHLGFCFSSSDAYVFIDLDDIDDPEQRQVFERINTYCQRSISGDGCHLICRGTFQGSGKHPSAPDAGLFKENRFCLMTGDVVAGRTTINDVAEEDLQAIHSWLGGGVERTTPDLVEYESEIPDATVVEMGCDRFSKFHELCCGRWQQYSEFHNDHSTADHAFIAMLCDLTESNAQVRNLFGMSGMWDSERAAKKAGHGFEGYVNRTISKIRGNQAVAVARSERVTLCFTEPEPLRPSELATQSKLIDTLPNGLIKDIAKYSYRSAYYPLEEASLSMSLSIMSALCGRAFLTPSKQGLNLWLILVGPSSCGKDEFQDGIGRLFGALHKRGLKSPTDLFGGELASGEALEQVFSTRKRYLSYMTEFGKKFKQIVAPHAPPHIDNLKRALLNSFNSAGISGAIRAREKAQRNENEIRVIERPCLTIAGETTPEPLYGAMTQADVDDGFLQRFMLLNVDPDSWSSRANREYGRLPSKSLLDTLERLVLLADTFDVDNSVKRKEATVVPATPDALKAIQDFEFAKRDCNRRGEGSPADRELGNRAAMKVWRISTLLAVSTDLYAPQIEMEHVRWAIDFVTLCDNALASRFKTGEVGSGQVKQEAEVLKEARRLFRLETRERKALGMGNKIAKQKEYIPLSVLKTEVIQKPCFASDKGGSVTAFEKCVASMVRSGQFTQVDVGYASDKLDYHNKGTLLCLQA